MIYTKLHRMSANSYKTVDLRAMARSSTPSPGTQWKPKIPSDGWGSSLEKAPLFTRERWTDILKSLGILSVGINMHIILFPHALKRLKPTLRTNIYTIFTQTLTSSTFIIIAKKRNESPHNLIIALCLISGEIVYVNFSPSCAAGKSGFCNHVLALMLKI